MRPLGCSVIIGRVAAESYPHAIVLDATLRQSLVAVRSLGRSLGPQGVEIHAFETASRAPAFASRYCFSSGVLPSFEQDPDAFTDEVIELARRFGHPVVFTAHDGSIDVLSRRRPELDRVAHLALPPEEALEIAADKRRTLDVAARLGLDVPVTFKTTDVREVRAAASEIGYPAVVKPVRSWGDDGENRRRVVATVHFEEKTLAPAADELLQLQGAAIVQPWLCGARQAISMLCVADEVRARFAQIAHRVVPLLGGSSVMRESIPLPSDITRASETLVRAIGLEGYSEVEFRRDARGRAMLMEINPRLSASVEVAVRSGVDFPLLLYHSARGALVPRVLDYRKGVRMRWLGGDIRWLTETISDRRHPDAAPLGTAVGNFVGDFLRPTHYDYVDAHDLRPAAAAAVGMGRGVLGRVLHRRPHSL